VLALKLREVFAEQDFSFDLKTILLQVDHPAVATLSGGRLVNGDVVGKWLGLGKNRDEREQEDGITHAYQATDFGQSHERTPFHVSERYSNKLPEGKEDSRIACSLRKGL
jgi:hypothetical protein